MTPESGPRAPPAVEFLYETCRFPEREYTFKHALTHEVAYEALQEQRRMLHVRIMTALEGLYADRLAEQVDRLAHHAMRGEVWDKAVTYGRQPGQGDRALGPAEAAEALSSSGGPPASPRKSCHARAGHRSPIRPAQCAASTQ